MYVPRTLPVRVVAGEHFKVKVTWDDIDFGTPRSYSGCPIARALARITGMAWHVNPLNAFPFASWHVRVPVPPTAQKFIQQYDKEETTYPFEFEARVWGK